MERPVIVNTSRTFISGASDLRTLLTNMLEIYSGKPIDDPEWLHDRGHSYGHIRTFRLGVHSNDAGNHVGQKSIAWTCDLLLHHSTWVGKEEFHDLEVEALAIYEAIGLIADAFGHDMTYANFVIHDGPNRSARMRHIEDPDGPLIPQTIIDTMTKDLPDLRYLVTENGNRKHNLRFGSSNPCYIPKIEPSATPVLDRVSKALSCIDPLRRMELLARCKTLLDTQGISTK